MSEDFASIAKHKGTAGLTNASVPSSYPAYGAFGAAAVWSARLLSSACSLPRSSFCWRLLPLITALQHLKPRERSPGVSLPAHSAIGPGEFI